ncbi:GNAT family N-acetyltransferase [Ectobacillus panaciterrae]|uniref:GNAT family N-acetyltransferase n=1 Tax=Ectobacillus panaciterrae TaxID=363872 RepID=UPI00041C18D2|nr:GNAT family N-acetyltransferase [Ectobacillus panaciterrae]
MSYCIQELQTQEELQRALPVMQELRPHLDEMSYFDLYNEMKKSGYRLIALSDEAGQPMALAGVAVCTNFYNLKHVYVYDLITASVHRSKGYGHELLSYVERWGKEKGCTYIDLTSAFHRVDAHRFYEREDYMKKSFSFGKAL